MQSNSLSQLEMLLGEPMETTLERERTAFDRAAAPFERSIVIFGAGNLGQQVLAGLRGAGIEPLAFADNNKALWGREVAGLSVLPPDAAAERYAESAVFVVTVWNPNLPAGIRTILEQLRQLGCHRVVPFVTLFWKYPERFLPYYLFDLPSKLVGQAAHVRGVYGLLSDDASRELFVRQVQFRLTGDFLCLPPPAARPEYFAPDFYRLGQDECFVDCGAFDGDTICAFLERTKGAFRRVIAFECDPVNYCALTSLDGIEQRLRERIFVHRAAVGATDGKVRFSATGSTNASVSSTGEIEVDCATLDRALAGERPTFIKMDIEGAELDALRGAETLIRQHKPLLAICVYHVQDHLWRIPLFIHDLYPGYRIFMQEYFPDGLELVCFAVPETHWP